MYVLSDVQGSSRAAMNNNGVGTSTVAVRHDYLPFGEEIGSGMRRAIREAQRQARLWEAQSATQAK